MFTKKLLPTLAMLFLLSATLFGQGSKNMSKLGELGYPQELSDVWGFVDGNGKEYALVGVRNGFSIVDVNQPASPSELFFVPGPTTTWRDVKVWDGYAYVTNEQSGGLLIVNLNYLPDSIQTSTWTGSGAVSFTSAHNIFIDEQGYGYIVGADHGKGGAIVVDLFTTPGTPILKTVYDVNYIHDCFVRGDTLWAAEINKGWFSVVDMSDKTQATVPQSKVLATHNTPRNFTHNVWLSDDGNYLYTTDERSGAYVAGYDVSDLGDIEETDRIRSTHSAGVIPHNTFFHNNFLVTAYYTDGVTIVDATRQHNLIETGYYDTSPLSGNGFNGAWGVYPYLPSGNILATDIQQGLFILGSDYTRACYLEGVVTDTFTTNPVHGVTVQIVATDATDQSDLVGQYATGLADSGWYDVTFSKTGYRSKTITSVRLDHGTVTQLDVALKPLIPIAVTGQVVDSVSGQGIPMAQVAFVGGDTSYYITCDNQGQFSASVYTDEYGLFAGSWGHHTKAWPKQLIDNQTNPFTLEITEGYYDDFLFDFGWSESSTAATGQWERGIPIGTSAGSFFANPDSDLPGDFGEMAYVTGNGGGSVGNDDIDDGATTLLSPVFDLSNEADPFLKFHYWFFNGFGAGNPNDHLRAQLTNGIDTVVVLHVTANDPGMGQWNEVYFRIADSLTPTANMQLLVTAVDFDPGHVAEAGLDGFEIIPGSELLPTVGFSSDVFTGCMPLTVQFYNESQNFDSFKWVMEGTDSVEYFAMDPTVTYDTAGLYDVKLIAENQFGKDSVVSTDFIEVLPQPTITALITFASNTTSNDGKIEITPTDTNPPYDYVWSDTTIGNTNIATGLAPGNYSVSITNSLGCISDFTFTIEVRWVGISESPAIMLNVFPNPANGRFTIETNLNESGTLTLYNITGQMVTQKELKVGNNQIHISDLKSPGLYFIEIHSGNQRVSRPLIYQP